MRVQTLAHQVTEVMWHLGVVYEWINDIMPVDNALDHESCHRIVICV